MFNLSSNQFSSPKPAGIMNQPGISKMPFKPNSNTGKPQNMPYKIGSSIGKVTPLKNG